MLAVDRQGEEAGHPLMLGIVVADSRLDVETPFADSQRKREVDGVLVVGGLADSLDNDARLRPAAGQPTVLTIVCPQLAARCGGVVRPNVKSIDQFIRIARKYLRERSLDVRRVDRLDIAGEQPQ